MPSAALLCLALSVSSLTKAEARAAELASRYFQEARWASDDDGGKLWRKVLYGPIILVDPSTKVAYANQADSEGKLRASSVKNVWTGTLGKDVGIANTAIDWAGTKWTMLMWPLPQSTANRTALMMHECWHRIQSEIGLPAGRTGDNQHLDSKEGRIWLRLEWRALSVALTSLDAERKVALTDALTFRAYRRSLFPGSEIAEDRMEVHEGMAEYTGVKLMGLSESGRCSYLAGRLKISSLKPSFSFSFAYETGPCYGLLLDMKDTPWRPALTTSKSLSELCRVNEGISLEPNLKASSIARAKSYDGTQIFAEEGKREQARVDKDNKFRKLLVDGPILELPLPHRNFTFDPNDVFPMGSLGRVFPESHIADDWGVLDVTGGVRIGLNYDTAFVAAPVGLDQMKGNGWTLTLNSGWKLGPGARKGDYKVMKG